MLADIGKAIYKALTKEGGKQAAKESAKQAGKGALKKGASQAGKSAKPTTQSLKAIRSYQKRISEHEQKLKNFKENPTVRPGMGRLPRTKIEAQQNARIRHLEQEIAAFKNNIQKIMEGF